MVAPPPPPIDRVSIDPNVTFLGHGTFQLTGHASSTAGVSQVELTTQVDGVTTDLGAATVNADGSFTFTDYVGAHTQGFLAATLTDGAGQTATAGAPGSISRRGSPAALIWRNRMSTTRRAAPVTAVDSFRQDGSRLVDVEASGLTLTSASFDTFANGDAPDNTFVFDPGHGQDVVRMFRATGTDHDTISLPASDFTSIADILSHTQQVTGGAVVIHDPVSGDTARLPGVSKAELANNRGISPCTGKRGAPVREGWHRA